MNKKKEVFLTGIIISNKKYKDNDKSVIVFTKEKGKISFVAKGARKLTSKNRSGIELLTLSQFYLYKSKAYYILMQSKLIYNFLYIRKNFNFLSIVMAMNCFVNIILPKEEPNELLYKLFLWSLIRFKKTKNPMLLLRYFLVKGIDYIGFSPDLNYCKKCGEIKGPFIFDFQEGLLFCKKCKEKGFLLEKKIIEFYLALKNDDFLKLNRIKLINIQIEKLDFFIEKWIEYIIDNPFNGFAFVKKINKN